MTYLPLADVVEALYDRAPGVPEATLTRAYLDAARRFLTVVQGHPYEVTAWAVPTDFAVYTPATLLQDSEITDATDVLLNSARLNQSTRGQTLAAGVGPTDTGTPVAFAVGTASLTLIPRPASDVSSTLYARLLLRPTLAATTILDTLVRDYFEPFEYGALQYIHAAKHSPMFDLKMSAYYGELFQAKMDWWSARAVDGGSGTVRTTRYYAPGRR